MRTIRLATPSGLSRRLVADGRQLRRAPMAIALVLSPLVGCGDQAVPRVALSGSVTVNGKPVPMGTLSLLPTGDTAGPVVTGEINDGNYQISVGSGPTFGTYRVEIEGFRGTGRTVRNLASPDRNTANPATMEERVSIVPAKFNVQSRLTANITPDTSTLDFELKY